MDLGNLYNKWFEIEGKARFQENTLIDYKKRFFLHIYPYLGHLEVKNLNYQCLQTYFNEHQNLGYRTLLKLKGILNTLMIFAIKCDYIKENPMKYVYIKPQEKEIRNKTISDENFEKVIAQLKNKRTSNKEAYIIALYIGKYTGLRISEVFALKNSDFDFEKQIIYVNKKMIYAEKTRKELVVVDMMKSKKSKGNVPFHPHLQEIIKKWLEIHPYTWIISDDHGDLLNPKQLEYILWQISKQLNIQFNFHTLRHTLATKLVSQGANLKATQEILRHANVATTINIYTHITEEQKLAAIKQAFSTKK